MRIWLSIGLATLVGLAVLLVVAAVLLALVPRLNEQVEAAQRAVGVSVAGEVNDHLRRSVAELERVASELAATGESALRRRTMLETVVTARDDLDALFLIGEGGQVIDIGLSPGRRVAREDWLGLDFSAREFLGQARETRRSVWSDAYLSQRGESTFAVVVPLPPTAGGRNPNPRLLLGEFSLRALSGWVAKLASATGLTAFVVDAQGHYVAHSQFARAQHHESAAAMPLIAAALDGSFGTAPLRLDERDYVATAVAIPDPGWIAVVAQPRELVYAPVRSTIEAVAFGSAGALLLAVAAAVFYGRRMTARVREFGEHVQAIADGDYYAPLPTSRTEELNLLATSMRRMADAILEREQALAASEARYRDLFMGAPLAYQALTMDACVSEVNDAWLALTGYRHDEVIGRPITDFIDEDSRTSFEEDFFPRFVADGRIDGPLFRLRRKDGESRAVMINGRVHHDVDGGARTHCILTDVTDRLRLEADKHKAEEALRRQAERAVALLELPEAAEGLGEEDFLRHGLDLLERLTGSAIGFAHWVEDGARHVTAAAWSSATVERYCRIPDDPAARRVALVEDAGLWAEALRTRQPVVINDYPSVDGRRGLPDGHSPLQRLLAVPVIEAGQPRLLVGIGNKATPYNELDVETARLISQDLWRLLARQRAQVAQRLAASVFASSAEGICVTDAEQRIVSANPALTAITGYAAGEIIGRTPKLFASDRHDAEFYRVMWANIAEHGVWRGEIWNRRKDGEVFPEWLTITAVKDDAGLVVNYIGSFFDISERKRAEEDIRFLAHHDPLTGLPNRALLDDRISQAIAASRRNQSQTALLFLDLDRFKLVNDTLGHDVGDCLLERVAMRLKRALRETETVARLGGDEFVVVIPEAAGVDRVAHVAQKMIDVVAEPQEVGGRTLHVTPSIGIAVYPDDGLDVQTLMRNADTAMYHAKECGRNNYQFYTAAMNQAVQERVAIEADLRLALRRGEFVLHYQPQVDARTGETTGVEALIRWRHPGHGLVLPERFIPVAEETGLIVEIGRWALNTACRQARRWRDAGHPQLRLGVNLSARQFQQRDLHQQVRQALADSGLPPAALEIELTESMLMSDPQATTDLMRKLVSLGISLAIDDFGTGYSSLGYLKRFPVSRLKIDRSFVRDISTDPNDAAIVRAVVAMADSLRLGVIAEGVETAEQIAFLSRHGCHEVQGYFYSPPRPAEDFDDSGFPRPSSA